MLERWRSRWDTSRLFYVGVASVAGLFFVHPLTIGRSLATLIIVGILLWFPSSWFQKNLATLLAELSLGVLLNLLVPGLGIFPLLVIAADTGTRDMNPILAVPLFLALGLAAAWGFVEVPGQPLPLSELALLSAVFAITMWANRQGVRNQLQLKDAYHHLKEAQEEVRELAGLKERERIAHELHDVLGHSLTLIILKAQLIEERLRQSDWAAISADTDALLAVARKSLDDVRGVVEAKPPRLTARTSLRALRQNLEDAGINVEMSWLPSDSWPPQLESDILMMLQETVTNILRHSGATKVRVCLTGAGSAGGWRLEVVDNGRGMSGPEGLGISGLRRRAGTWGGQVAIESGQPECGTRLVVTGFEMQHG